jgi:hypothetical protein
MYAWSRFATDINEWGQVGKYIEPGDEVSQDDLGVSDDEWQELQDVGAVREEAYPDVDAGESPAQYYLENPDEAPEVAVDESTPMPEAQAKQDIGMAMGSKAPGATAAAEAEAEAPAPKADESSSGGGTPSS